MANKEKPKIAEDKTASRKYSKPKVEKHENLKEITLLSFTPPSG